jgi:hypothetical protein
VLAVSGLTYAAVGLIPATGVADPAAAAQSVFCSASDLGSGSPTTNISGRGSDNREPDLGEVHEDLPAAAKGKAGKNFRTTVPVYFHVVTDGAMGVVTDEQIATQISVLNNGQRRLVRRQSRRHERALHEADTAPGRYLDGVVVDWESMKGTSTTYANEYDQGETGTHEVGPLAEPGTHLLRRLQRQG